ncbi:MAG: amidohydrolase family protein [Verrucomicrobia bacterium]|nr:amidohydrolase family protein [Verrucomicrobiota bacterium]
MGESKQLLQRIQAAVDAVRLIDTHEHLPPEAERNARSIDLFTEFFAHYALADLVSAGFPQDKIRWLHDSKVALDERWAAVAPYWARMRRTGYARSLLISARELFGIDDISERTYGELSAKIAAANKPGWYRTVLKERCGIERSILDTDKTECDRELFAPVRQFDPLVSMLSRDGLRNVEQAYGVSIRSIDTLAKTAIGLIEEAATKGVVALKICLAYCRSIRFEKTARADAERVLSRLLGNTPDDGSYPDGRISWCDAKPLHNFIVHTLIETCERVGLPVQIHTGLQEGYGNYIVNSKPTDLANLFMEYPKCRFDIFHGGYPYSRELATLAKNFQNVTIDMCWMHIVSPAASCAMLHEWLDMVPETKILGFGGDYLLVEGVYGHARMARENVARVLTERVLGGTLSEDEAIVVATRLLRTNAAEVFKIVV